MEGIQTGPCDNGKLMVLKKKEEVTEKNSESHHICPISHAYTQGCLEWERMFSEVRTGLLNSLPKTSQNIVSPPYKMILI